MKFDKENLLEKIYEMQMEKLDEINNLNGSRQEGM